MTEMAEVDWQGELDRWCHTVARRLAADESLAED